MTFHRENILSRSKMPQEQLDKYYEMYRKARYEAGKGPGNVIFRKMIHPILLFLIILQRIMKKEKIILLRNDEVSTKRPVIYACTHIGGHDVERCFEAIKKHAFLFIGDPKEVYRNFDGVLLFANGMICLETRSKEDRYIAKMNAIELLNKNGKLLIYPEGVWNISENLLVNPMYMGTASIAMKTNADIVPVAIEQYDKTFYVSIGQNIECGIWNSTEVELLTKHIRDELATLKWEIFEARGIQSYESITKELRNNWINAIFARADYSYTVQDVYDTQYITDEQKEMMEIYSDLSHLIPSIDNAFLFRELIQKKL